MKIKCIQTYQPVRYNNRPETFFSVVLIAGKKKIDEIRLMKELPILEIKGDEEIVLIPLTNVAAIYPWSVEDDKVEQEKEERKKLKVAVDPSEIKRPK
jgi:hypothetical protein